MADLPLTLTRPGFCSRFCYCHSEVPGSLCTSKEPREFLGTGNVMFFPATTLVLWGCCSILGRAREWFSWFEGWFWSFETLPSTPVNHYKERVNVLLRGFCLDWTLWLCHLTSLQAICLSLPSAPSPISFIMHTCIKFLFAGTGMMQSFLSSSRQITSRTEEPWFHFSAYHFKQTVATLLNPNVN